MTLTASVQEPCGQMTFVPALRVLVAFDPFAHGWGKNKDEGFAPIPWGNNGEWHDDDARWDLFRGCYSASPAHLPCVSGEGNSIHWALVDLARKLREMTWTVEPDLTAKAQLAHAARNLDQRGLVRYLKRHAAPPELATGYALVLR